MASKTTKGASAKVRKVQPLFGNEKYPDVPIGSIEIVERPSEGEEHQQLFFNPRPTEDFTPDSMAELRHSIRIDGLLHNLVVRTIGDEKGGDPKAIQLVAGERRYRTLKQLVADNVPCYAGPEIPAPREWLRDMMVIHGGRFAMIKEAGKILKIEYLDEHDQLSGEVEEVDGGALRPTRPAAEVYAFVPCKVIRQCSDRDALRLATTENLKRKTLSVAAQVALAERLVKMGLSQKQITEALGTNITWVSQTLGFRQDLPPDAFEALLMGKLKRHVAVGFLSYAPADRQRLYEATVVQAEADAISKISAAQIEVESHEDMADVEQTKAKKAAASGDVTAAARHKSKASAEQAKATKKKARLARVKKEQGQIKQTHLQTAAATLDIAPKKTSKMLTKPEIESLIAKLEEAVDSKVIDAIAKQPIPAEMAALGALFLRGVIDGLRDPFQPIRQQMVAEGNWEEEEEGDDFEDPDDDDLRDMDDDDDDYSDEDDLEQFGVHAIDDDEDDND